MNKSHYALVFVLVGVALLVVSFTGDNTRSDTGAQQRSQTTTQAASPTKTSANQESGMQIDFAFKDLQDTLRHASEWQGNILVVNFWATWCTPCRHEIPAFNNLQKKYAQQGVQFLGLAYDDKAAIERFMSIIPIDYPVLYGDEEIMDLSMKYGNIQSILPYTLFVDKQGKVFHIQEGLLSEQATEQILAKAL